MTSNKINLLIEKEKKNLEKLTARKKELEEKIKKSEAKLRGYEVMKNNDTFNVLSGIVQEKGLTVEEVLSALQNGDLLSLQEQMESSDKQEVPGSEEQPAYDNSNGENYHKTY